MRSAFTLATASRQDLSAERHWPSHANNVTLGGKNPVAVLGEEASGRVAESAFIERAAESQSCDSHGSLTNSYDLFGNESRTKIGAHP